MDKLKPHHLDEPAAVRENLARTLRHEIGDFLQRVYSAVALLQRKFPPEWDQEKEILLGLRHHAESCKNLVDAVRDFLLPMQLDWQSVNLTACTESWVAAVQREFPDKQVILELEAATVLRGDPKWLNQMGLSILRNACEFALKKVNVRIVFDRSVQKSFWSVLDDGPGVPVAQLARLFDPFFSTQSGHAGLGLTQAQKIIHLHGGDITLANVAGGGFRVDVSLPISA